MSEYTLLISAPEDTQYGTLPEDVQAILVDLETIYPQGAICPGSTVNSAKKMLLAVIRTDAADVALMLESLIALYELDWTILALRDTHKSVFFEEDEEGNFVSIETLNWQVDPDAAIYDYLPDIVIYDQDGIEISRTRPTDLSGVSIYQGHAGWAG